MGRPMRGAAVSVIATVPCGAGSRRKVDFARSHPVQKGMDRWMAGTSSWMDGEAAEVGCSPAACTARVRVPVQGWHWGIRCTE